MTATIQQVSPMVSYTMGLKFHRPQIHQMVCSWWLVWGWSLVRRKGWISQLLWFDCSPPTQESEKCEKLLNYTTASHVLCFPSLPQVCILNDPPVKWWWATQWCVEQQKGAAWSAKSKKWTRKMNSNNEPSYLHNRALRDRAMYRWTKQRHCVRTYVHTYTQLQTQRRHKEFTESP